MSWAVSWRTVVCSLYIIKWLFVNKTRRKSSYCSASPHLPPNRSKTISIIKMRYIDSIKKMIYIGGIRPVKKFVMTRDYDTMRWIGNKTIEKRITFTIYSCWTFTLKYHFYNETQMIYEFVGQFVLVRAVYHFSAGHSDFVLLIGAFWCLSSGF